MPTKKVRKICWKCRRKLIISKTIKFATTIKKYNIDYNLEQYWCIECCNRLKEFLNNEKCLNG